ncbi:MAG: hypothetical protein RR034_04370 [Bacteroidales bacterium]
MDAFTKQIIPYRTISHCLRGQDCSSVDSYFNTTITADRKPIFELLLETFQVSPDGFMDHAFKQAFYECKKDAFAKATINFAKDAAGRGTLSYLNNEAVEAWNTYTENKYHKSISKDNSSPFHLLRKMAYEFIVLHQDQPHFNMQESINWYHITHTLGEDIFTTAFYAEYFDRYGVAPPHFQWTYILRSNFHDLNAKIAHHKICENHYHLTGSSPNMDLSWISLMNYPFEHQKGFEELKNANPTFASQIVYACNYQQTDIGLLVKIAARLRMELFKKCCLHVPAMNFNYLMDIVKRIRKRQFFLDAGNELKSEIVRFSLESPLRTDFVDTLGTRFVDYAIRGFKINKEKPYGFISGERHLYYCCMRDILKDDAQAKNTEIVFYLYLLIKYQFDKYFIQNNKKYGFDNFVRYNEKKWYFIKGTQYEKIALQTAISHNINENCLESLELRTAPRNNHLEMLNYINEVDHAVKQVNIYSTADKIDYLFQKANKKKEDYFFVYHFIKNQKCQWNTDELIPSCREKELRDKIKKEALAVYQLRKSGRKEAAKLWGIDAANFEVHCRAEIFGQTFRYLSRSHVDYEHLHYQKNLHLQTLRKTYHVGEDFYDIVDGLRAIDEAILFLDLKHGDRIGHGVALGLNAQNYYAERPTIVMPLQNAVDNMAWILYKIAEWRVNISQAYYADLRSKFDELFCKLYYNRSCEFNQSDFQFPPDLRNYIKAWKLRGDDPEFYRSNYEPKLLKQKVRERITQWDKFALLNKEEYERMDEIPYNMHRRYHYDSKLKEEAHKGELVTIPSEYVEIVKQLQRLMRNHLLCKGIAIESNPTSNFLISNLQMHKEVPLYNLFPIEEIDTDTVRLNVSINTDDQGVFYTSLVKEYTLLVAALQQQYLPDGITRKYSNDKILTWIEKLIGNGKAQCFRR